MMKAYLAKDGIILSKTSVHKYMNKLLGLKSVVRRANPNYRHGKKNNVFNNELAQEFKATRPNEKWCTDFTYIHLSNGTVRYNCTIIDLYDRSAVVTMCDDSITSSLAIRTLEKAIENHDIKYGELLNYDHVIISSYNIFCNEQSWFSDKENTSIRNILMLQ